MRKLVIGTIIVMLAGTACWPFDGDDALGAMKLRRTGDGRVELHRDGDVINVTDEASLELRDVIVTKDDATAELQLADGRRALLAPDSQHLVVDTATIESQQGSLLADASAPMTVTFAGAEARFSSALFRVDRALGASRAATYEGRVRLSVPGERLSLAPLFQTSVSAADFDSPDPYRLNKKDVWDITYLADVLDLDKELGQFAAGFASQVGKTRPTVGFFSGLAEGKRTGFMKRYIDSRVPTADLLIGFTVGLEADGALDDRVDDAFDLFEDGARWGVAATIMDVNRNPLIATLDDIIETTGVASAEPGEGPDFSTEAGVLASGPGEAPPDTGGGGGNDPGNDDPDDPGGGGDDPEPPEDCENTAECAVQDIQEQNPLASPSPSPSSLLDNLPPP
ncbi:MAG: hypothetical protein ACRDJI_11705 [Actinomycetota bacterium]